MVGKKGILMGRNFSWITWVWIPLAMVGVVIASSPSGAEPPSASASVPDGYVWIEPLGLETSNTISIRVDARGQHSADQPLAIDCELRSETPVANAVLRVDIVDAKDETAYRKDQKVSLRREGASHPIQWNASNMPDGSYKARFQIMRWKGSEIARRDYTIRKVSANALRTGIQNIETALGRLPETQGAASSYVLMRIAVATDCLARARQAVETGDWRTADRLERYLLKAVDAIGAQLSLGNSVPEIAESAPKPDLALVEVKNGALYAAARPAFLFGRYYGSEWPSDLSRLRAYGLDLAAFSVGPKDTLAGPDQETDFARDLDNVFQQAGGANVAVMVSLAPQAMCRWLLDEQPFLLDAATGSVDITQPVAKDAIGRHFRAVIPYLAQQKMLKGLCLANKPGLKFTGDETRNGFMTAVTDRYRDRQGVNNAWHGLFGSLDEIAIGWDRNNPAHKNTARYMDTTSYRYDWLTYHQGLGAAYFKELASWAKSLDSTTPLFIALAGNILDSRESESGPDFETLSPSFGFSGCSALDATPDSRFALAYPQPYVMYTLLRSLAPDKPVINFNDRVIPSNETDAPVTFAHVHTAMWEAAMAGLNASALDARDALAFPECLEAYATSCLDLNRLADIVTAFQQAPADVAILWSSSSAIYDKGFPYLPAVRYAFEGCSFSGQKVRFVTEKQCADGALDDIKVLVLPEVLAVNDRTFQAIKAFLAKDKTVVRTSKAILYNEHGQSRRDILSDTKYTVLVRGRNQILAPGFLHGMDAVIASGVLGTVPRTINQHGYPLEGVQSRYVEVGGQRYLYVVNIRKDPVICHVTGDSKSGRDLIVGRDVSFPMQLEPLDPMLIRLAP